MKQNAFSLVELSIVLVILGLLTGGILTGQSLIRAAELRAINTEFATYQTAVMTFRSKYFALPGDMNNASRFWGAADGGDATGADCKDAVGSGTETCNGNGDGRIVDESFSQEMMRAWQHLANANLISGEYVGTKDPADSAWVLTGGYNVPTSKQGNALWQFCNTGSRQYGNGERLRLVHATYDPASSECSIRGNAGLTPAEAYSVDVKADDGKPGLGKIAGLGGYNSGSWLDCTTGPDGSTAVVTADYQLASDDDLCLLQFLLQ